MYVVFAVGVIIIAIMIVMFGFRNSMRINLKTGYWNKMLYSGPNDIDIAFAFSPIIPTTEVTIWSIDGKGYKSTAPYWANDLKWLLPQGIYLISVSRDVSLHFPGAKIISREKIN